VPFSKRWSPDSPTLYNVTVKLDQNHVESYTGFRTISKGLVHGIARPLLKGKFIFMSGVLDQYYGLMVYTHHLVERRSYAIFRR
jgi:hypothetical protein